MATTILMNPVNYTIKDEDNAFVISADIEYANGIEELATENREYPELRQEDLECL
jgi:hypothetical protein|eukprot:CAMPEP_0168313760 /NCGR_PEP_ID=MMETSP0210-20121227/4198_1 /TAXON_ID=40633 /ORGANISM="Condylostoma magnum, Strain COL2" /LENGTH=54 /DNA_ID=CAMNT_0008274509 /DNA_START=1615 /DNA_END=1779 /DNA_ORIENTATION=-